MSRISYTFSGPRLKEKLLKALEVQLGTGLPPDYRKFLLKQNGGTPEPAFFPRAKCDSLFWVDYLCSLDEHLLQPSAKSEYNTLSSAAQRHGAYVPSDAIIIGYCCRDDLLLLFIRGRRLGQVHLKAWDEVGFESPENLAKSRSKAIYKVAKSFSDFLGLLQEDSDESDD